MKRSGGQSPKMVHDKKEGKNKLLETNENRIVAFNLSQYVGERMSATKRDNK